MTLPPEPGRKTSCPVTGCDPELKIVSSVRHEDPPAPSVCALAETSDRYGAIVLTLIERVAVLVDMLLKTVMMTM